MDPSSEHLLTGYEELANDRDSQSPVAQGESSPLTAEKQKDTYLPPSESVGETTLQTSATNRDQLAQSDLKDQFYQMASSPEPASEEKKKSTKKNKKKDGSDFASSTNELILNEDSIDANLEDLVYKVDEAEDGSTQQTKASPQQKTAPSETFNPLRDVLGESFYEDDDSSEDEGMPDYKIGGYHPIHVGEILLDRYVIIQKLGWGHFSTVWLTKDLRFNSYVALKVQKSAQHYVEAAYDEVDILNQVAENWKTEEWGMSIDKYYENDKYLLSRLGRHGVTSESSHCALLLNSFIHHGPNGKHFIMVFEILGVNFLEIIKRYDYKGVPLPLVRRLARQCLIGLDYMHRMCHIIHTDFKPENVVICLRDDEAREISKTG
mmetsp:Transcript_4599/g.7005  ORF Transcript_4599/g.7005 Transcript_4599/m.7005 type:complete len:378 (-) Transcript_4599:1550-2683(-)